MVDLLKNGPRRLLREEFFRAWNSGAHIPVDPEMRDVLLGMFMDGAVVCFGLINECRTQKQRDRVSRAISDELMAYVESDDVNL